MTALLITGSRSFRDGPVRAWDRMATLIRMAIYSLEPSIVIAGDARGPDTYALDYCGYLGIPTECWCLNGIIGCLDPRRWATPEELRAEPFRRVPLFRNKRMVASVAERFPGAWCVAAIDPASATHGTGQTAGLAGQALGRERVVWCVYGV